MTSSSHRRMSWRLVTPVVAIAALGLTACSNSEQASNVPGSTPPVWTGSANPSGHGSAQPGAAGSTSGAGSAGTSSLTADLKTAAGASVGTVTFTEEGDHVRIEAHATGQNPGFHGFHVHSVGKCEPNSTPPGGGAPGNFLSAGGHLQVPGHTGHPSSGDLTSLEVIGDGTATLVTTTSAFTLQDLKDADGASVIIHENADNFGNIPTRYAPAPDQETLNTGDAGARVACGVIG